MCVIATLISQRHMMLFGIDAHFFSFPRFYGMTQLQVENSLRLSSLLPLKLCILISLHHRRSTVALEEGEVSVTEIYIYIYIRTRCLKEQRALEV